LNILIWGVLIEILEPINTGPGWAIIESGHGEK
jgi:hypothetical protein